MKRIYTWLTLVLVIATAISCSKTSDPQPNNNNNNNNTTDTNFYFTAKIDGADWSADMQSTNTSITSSHQGLLTIQAALSPVTSGVFLINLYNYNGAGTYTVGTGGTNSYARYMTGSVATSNYSAWKAETPGSITTGTFTITKDDGSIVEGTFSFDGYSEETKDTKKITDGKFRMKK